MFPNVWIRDYKGPPGGCDHPALRRFGEELNVTREDSRSDRGNQKDLEEELRVARKERDQSREQLQQMQHLVEELEKERDESREQLQQTQHLVEELKTVVRKERDESRKQLQHLIEELGKAQENSKQQHEAMATELQKAQESSKQQHEAMATKLQKKREQLSKFRSAGMKWKTIAEEYSFAHCQAVFERCLCQARISTAALRWPIRAVNNPADKYDLCLNNLFHEMPEDLATVINTIIQAIDTTMKIGCSNNVLWRTRAALRLMFYVFRTMDKMLVDNRFLVCNDENGDLLLCDEELDEALRSADLQLVKTLEEVVETHPEYDYTCALVDMGNNFTEKFTITMIGDLAYLYPGAKEKLSAMKAQCPAEN